MVNGGASALGVMTLGRGGAAIPASDEAGNLKIELDREPLGGDTETRLQQYPN
jgi:hypothetical protein